jgi:hypothetical protein
MAASLIDDVAEGLRVDMRDGSYVITLVLHAQDLEGATILDKLSAAEDLLSTDYDSVTYRGVDLPRQSLSLDPWPPADTGITLTFAKSGSGSEPETSEDKGAAFLSGGTSAELAETDFDADNLLLTVTSRTPIHVEYDKANTTPGADSLKQDARVPVYAAKSTFSFSRISNVEPSGDSRLYAGKTNSGTFFGMTANTVLCLAYVFEQQLDGSYRETISFAYDPLNEWRQFARYQFADGSYPQLTTAMIAAANGMTIVTVQGEEDFDGMDLVLYTP